MTGTPPDARYLDVRFLRLLRALHVRATAAGTRLHVSAAHEGVHRSLRAGWPDRLVRVRPAAELVVAGPGAP